MKNNNNFNKINEFWVQKYHKQANLLINLFTNILREELTSTVIYKNIMSFSNQSIILLLAKHCDSDELKYILHKLCSSNGYQIQNFFINKDNDAYILSADILIKNTEIKIFIENFENMLKQKQELVLNNEKFIIKEITKTITTQQLIYAGSIQNSKLTHIAGTHLLNYDEYLIEKTNQYSYCQIDQILFENKIITFVNIPIAHNHKMILLFDNCTAYDNLSITKQENIMSLTNQSPNFEFEYLNNMLPKKMTDYFNAEILERFLSKLDDMQTNPIWEWEIYGNKDIVFHFIWIPMNYWSADFHNKFEQAYDKLVSNNTWEACGHIKATNFYLAYHIGSQFKENISQEEKEEVFYNTAPWLYHLLIELKKYYDKPSAICAKYQKIISKFKNYPPSTIASVIFMLENQEKILIYDDKNNSVINELTSKDSHKIWSKVEELELMGAKINNLQMICFVKDKINYRFIQLIVGNIKSSILKDIY